MNMVATDILCNYKSDHFKLYINYFNVKIILLGIIYHSYQNMTILDDAKLNWFTKCSQILTTKLTEVAVGHKYKVMNSPFKQNNINIRSK